ncbi:MAG: histidinol-phosphate transaminase [Opitutales bacterium]
MKDQNRSPLHPAKERARKHVPLLASYVPGLQPSAPGWTKLNTNENPYPPSPVVEEAIRQKLGDGLRFYPDPRSGRLRDALGKLHGFGPESICVGNGSDDILNLLVRCYCDPERAAGFTVPSYSLYPVLVAIQDGEGVTWEFDRSMRLDVDRLASLPANILFLTSPNAPTGVAFPLEEIERLLEEFPGIVVVDEAYGDFADSSAIELIDRFPRLCVTRSFSKAYSLAGLRIGYAAAQPALIGILDRVRDSYNVNCLAQAGALAALEDRVYFQALWKKIITTREFYVSEFRKLGWFTYDSCANFIFTEPTDANGRATPDVARSLYEHLYRNKVLVRYFSGHALTSTFLRISVGSEPEMLTLMETVNTWPENA